jgi:hypothetical protein
VYTLTLQVYLLVSRLGRIEAQEFGKFASILRVLVDTELQILPKGLVEFGEIILVLRDFGEEIQALLDDVLPDNFKDLVLLERFTRNVEREIFRIDDTLDKVQVLGNKVLAVVHDENAANVKFDVVTLLLRLKEIKRRADCKDETRIQRKQTRLLTA